MKEKLYPFHVTILVFMIQSGVVVFTLPRLLALHMGYNGWAFLFIYFGIVALNIMIISQAYRLSNGKSIFHIMEQALPKVIVVPLYIFLLSLWTMIGCMAAKQYVNIYQVFVFPTTHPMLIKLLVDVLAFILILKGIYNISKAATTFFWLIIWTLLLLLFFIKDFNWVDLTPFFFHKASDPIMGGLQIYTAFLGYELVLLLFPFTDKNKRFMRAVHIGNLLTTISYLAICLICFGFYNLNQLKRMKFPVIDLLAYIEFPFVERIENLIFSLFVFTTIIGIVMYIWAAAETAKRVIPKANYNWITGTLIAIAYSISWIPDVLGEVEKWLKFLGFIEIGVAWGLPMLLVIILLLTKRRDEACAENND